MLLVCLAGIGSLLWWALQGNSENALGDTPLVVGSAARLPEGVTILGIDVGGQTKTAAKEAVTESADTLLAQAQVTLRLEGQSFTIKGSDMGLAYNIEEVLAQALAYEPPDKDAGNVVDVTDSGTPGAFDDIFSYDASALRRALESIAETFDVAPVDAIGEPTMHADHTVSFTYQDGQNGRALRCV